MKHLFLSSAVGVDEVAVSIRRKIGGTQKLKTAFLTTPVEGPVAEDDMSWVDVDRNAMRNANFDIFDYTITGKTLTQIKAELSDIDVLYISGGNEYYLKYQCNLTRFGDYVREFVETGKPYIGISAGSIIMGQDMSVTRGITPAKMPGINITDLTGLGVVDFTVLPHWGSSSFKNDYLNNSFEHMYAENNQLILLNNHEYVEVQGDKHRIVDVRSEK